MDDLGWQETRELLIKAEEEMALKAEQDWEQEQNINFARIVSRFQDKNGDCLKGITIDFYGRRVTFGDLETSYYNGNLFMFPREPYLMTTSFESSHCITDQVTAGQAILAWEKEKERLKKFYESVRAESPKKPNWFSRLSTRIFGS